MLSLFEYLSKGIEGAPFVALLAALLWGVLSIVLSPCHLASIPLIVGYISGQPEMNSRKALWTASSFAIGILCTIAVIGAITSAAGRMMGNLGPWANYGVAAVFFVVGLSLLGVFTLPVPGVGAVGMKSKGYGAAFLLGAVFGVALGPCTFAFMAPVLVTTLKVSTTAPIFATGLLLAYGIGHCAVIVGAGASTQSVQTLLNWNARTHGVEIVKRICGALVILGGLNLINTAN